MKRLVSLLAALLILASPAWSTLAVLAKNGPNLISNSSLETAENNAPVDWHSNKWGTLDANFTYSSEGADESTRSVRVDVSNYQSGDAKWYFEPVSVQGGQNYTYSTLYKASAPSEVVMQLKDSTGNTTYQWLRTVAANPLDWQVASASFKAPENVVSATVFHVINGNGYLQTDEAYFGLTDTAPTPPPVGDNLIPNQSMETPDSNNPQKPAYWTSNTWGNHTAVFSYLPTGYDGSRSLKTEITQYTDGDAKWYFDPVAIEGGQRYTFKENYSASWPTEFVMGFVDANGNWSYQWVQTVGPASGWRELTVDFTAPANAEKATVLHVLNGVGELWTDNARLSKQAPVTNPVPNPSLEHLSGETPANWSYNRWGTNDASFSLGEGRTGNYSVITYMDNHQSGDAKWYFDPITSLQPGKRYRFNAWYKTNTTPKVVAMFNKTDGTTQYVGLPNALPNSDSATVWQQYSDTFTVPANTQSTSILFLIDKNGWLQTDDYNITDYAPVGFDRPLVTLTFDDGQEDNVSTALPVMNGHGFKSTQCFATDHIEGDQAQVNRILQFRDSGHEICSHTVNHPFLTTLSSADRDYELRHAQQYLQSITGAPIKNFASPYGDYNMAVMDNIAQYYRSHRTVDEGYNSKDNFNVYRLRVQNMLSTTTVAELNSWLAQAKADNTWLILVYHRIGDDPGPYDNTLAQFQQQMAALKASGLAVKTYDTALDEVLAQL